MNLRPYQVTAHDGVISAWEAGARNVMLVLPTGAGKCLGRGTPILMFDGTVKAVETVEVGELLMGPDSQPRKVLTTCTGVEQLYKVVPVKGDPYVVNESHILSLKQTGLKKYPKYPCQQGKGTVVNISVSEYLSKSANFKHTHKGWRTGVDWHTKVLPDVLPPYLLGLWLGDGHSRAAGITTSDPEIVGFLKAHSKKHGMELREEVLSENAANSYHFSKSYNRAGNLRTVLREYDLLRNKHIPLDYKTGSRAQRLELLAGLIDSDGYADKTGYAFTFKSEKLATDIEFLCRSLGFAAYRTVVSKTCTNTGATGEYHSFQVAGDLSEVPVLLERRKVKPRGQIKNPLVTGIHLEKMEVGEYFGFEIDGDRLFLLGDFTVTHNTVTFSETIKEHAAPACAIAHRQELVGQISMALARDKVRHRIIGPSSVVKAVVRDHMEELGKSYYDPNALTGVAGVDTLVKRKDQLAGWLQSVTLWVQDECFPAGTLVEGKPIEQIQVGDFVTSYNEVSGKFEQKEVTRLFKSPAPSSMVKVSSKAHHAIICTCGHPFFTKRGWVEAINLKIEDEVLSYEVQMHPMPNRDPRSYREPKVSFQENRAHLLHQKVWIRASASKPYVPGTRSQRGGLYDLWEPSKLGQTTPKTTVQKNGKGVLQYRMQCRVSTSSFIKNNGHHKSKVRIRAYDFEKSHALCRIQKENGCHLKTHWASSKAAGWKRKIRYYRRGEASGVTEGAWFSTPSNCKNRARWGCYGLPEALQDRLRERTFKNSSRSRWVQPRYFEAKRARRSKRPVSQWIGLESISVLKSRDIDQLGDGFVYNIEVDGNHNYLVDGVLVHNCHHVLEENKWGTAAAMFPNAKGLGVTATPRRADGKGLGRESDGVFDVMIVGPSMRELITMGYLTDYKIYAPPSDIDFGTITISQRTGDYNQDQVVKAVRKSHVVGDVVDHYLKLAKGKLGVTFATDVQTATDIADQFNAHGVPAAVVSAKTSDMERKAILRRFRNRELLQLVNVDLFGEGFDLPAIEVVSMARPTQSFSLYCQQFGRALRLMLEPWLRDAWDTFTDAQRRDYILASTKPRAIIIDHVGNVVRHGLPDAVQNWSLEAREKRSRGPADDVIPLKSCPECTGVYEKIYPTCPYCGYKPVPALRSGPEYVDGDLVELDLATLAQMRGEAAKIDMTPAEVQADLARRHVPHIGQLAQVKRHVERQSAQGVLREAIAYWAGAQRALNRSDSESYRRFYFKFGTDVLSAQALGTKDAIALAERVSIDIATIV